MSRAGQYARCGIGCRPVVLHRIGSVVNGRLHRVDTRWHGPTSCDGDTVAVTEGQTMESTGHRIEMVEPHEG